MARITSKEGTKKLIMWVRLERGSLAWSDVKVGRHVRTLTGPACH